MALSIRNIGKLSYLDGVYNGQTKSVLLGNKANSGRNGRFLIGCQFGDDNVSMKAFVGLLENYTPDENSEGFLGLVQAGRLSINGVTIPPDGTQDFFPAKGQVRTSDGWWIDIVENSDGSEINQPFYPFNAKADDADITEEQLFFYPQPFGNLARIKPASGFMTRYDGESLSVSLSSNCALNNLPVPALPDVRSNIINQLIDSVDSLGFRYNIPQADLNAVFDFIETSLRSWNLEFSPNYVVQGFKYPFAFVQKVGFAVRGFYNNDQETVYTITFDPANGQNQFTAYFKAWPIPAGTADATVLDYFSTWYSQQLIAYADNPKPTNANLNFFSSLITNMQQDTALGSSKITGLQRAGAFYLRRNNFKNDDYQNELIYIMNVASGNTSSWQLYPFGLDYYYELDEDELDPLNIYTNYAGVPPSWSYTYDQLLDFLRSKGINLQIGVTDPITFQYDFQVNICEVKYENGKEIVIVYDGFYWKMARTADNKNSPWKDIAFAWNGPSSSQDNMGMIRLLTDFYSNVRMESPEIRKGFI